MLLQPVLEGNPPTCFSINVTNSHFYFSSLFIRYKMTSFFSVYIGLLKYRRLLIYKLQFTAFQTEHSKEDKWMMCNGNKII